MVHNQILTDSEYKKMKDKLDRMQKITHSIENYKVMRNRLEIKDKEGIQFHIGDACALLGPNCYPDEYEDLRRHFLQWLDDTITKLETEFIELNGLALEDFNEVISQIKRLAQLLEQ